MANGTKKLDSRLAVGFLALTATFLWGSAFPMVQLCTQGFFVAADDIPARLLLAGWRFTAAGALVALLCRRKRLPISVPKGCRVQVLLIGLLTTSVQYACNYVGLAHTTGGRASIWGQVSTFLLVILSGAFDPNDRLTKRKIGGSLLGLAGILAANLGAGAPPMQWNGDGLLLLGALGSTAGALLFKRTLQQMGSEALTAWLMLVGGGVLLAAGLITGGRLDACTAAGAFSLAYLVLVSSVAYGLWMMLAKRRPLSEISVYRFGIPLSGVLCSGLLTGEKIATWNHLLSLALVAAGIVLVNRPGHRSARLGMTTPSGEKPNKKDR